MGRGRLGGGGVSWGQASKCTDVCTCLMEARPGSHAIMREQKGRGSTAGEKGGGGSSVWVQRGRHIHWCGCECHQISVRTSCIVSVDVEAAKDEGFNYRWEQEGHFMYWRGQFGLHQLHTACGCVSCTREVP